MLEAHIGIIGANMALARYVWQYFIGDEKSSKQTPYNRAGYENYGRSGISRRYGPSSAIRPEDGLPLHNVDSLKGSALDGIRKTTTIRIQGDHLQDKPGSSLTDNSLEEGVGPLDR